MPIRRWYPVVAMLALFLLVLPLRSAEASTGGGLPSWLTWTNALWLWGTIWALATAAQGAFAPASVMGRIIHAILAVSPLDVVKAFKAIGGSLVPPGGAAGLLLVVLLASHQLACASASPAAPVPMPPPDQQAELAILGSEEHMCTHNGTSRADIDSCIGTVEAYWCGDAGPLRLTAACDAGAAK